MCSSVKPSCPDFCTSDPAPGVGCFGGQRSPEIYTSSAAERQSSYTASQDWVEVRVEKTHLLDSRAAAQVQIFGLQTFGFSQDGLDLEVDLVGDLWSSKAVRKCVWGGWLAGSPGSELPWCPPAWRASCSWSWCWRSSGRAGPPPGPRLSQVSS